MNIVFHQESQTFHLYNDLISYVIKVLKNGQLGQVYYGKAIKDRSDFDHLVEFKQRAMAPCVYEDDDTFSMEHMKQEYPGYGHGDMRMPAFDILQDNGSRVCEFVYDHHIIQAGKPALEGLPATYAEGDEEAKTLVVYLADHLINMEIALMYTIYDKEPVICRSVKITNHGSRVVLQRAMSLSLDLPDANYTMLELTGAWARERSIEPRKLVTGVQSVYSLRGHSSNNYNPFIALVRDNTTEDQGEAIGFSFVYSGNFLAQVEVDTYHVARVMMGIHPHCFDWSLDTNESFQCPEVVMVYSDRGLNAMSQSYHRLYTHRLARGKYRDKPRPILINNWEGTYFDFNEEKILSMASTASKLGIELFVLDDGWFGKRNNDFAGLGDWDCNLDKLPNGISGLSRKIEELGMKFGLWFEPEMVNKDSDLYRTHPEWVLATPDRSMSPGRHQYVLDFSNPEVVKYIGDKMAKIIEESKISYIKWDMNRSMSEVYSTVHDASTQGKVMHQYILGVYALYERLTSAYPDILFESCSSGGARFDPGMLYYAPQAWTSDDTDAIERLKIQYGTSLVYPISSMGSHVSASPNHQLHRLVPIETRANVAYFGTFGYELDVNKLDEETLETMKRQIIFMKENRQLIQYGTFYRLLSPFTSKETAWMVVSEDKTEAIVAYYRPLQEVNVGYRRLLLQGLDPDQSYTIDGHEYYGDELMHAGLVITDDSCGENNGQQGDYYSRLYLLK